MGRNYQYSPVFTGNIVTKLCLEAVPSPDFLMHYESKNKGLAILLYRETPLRLSLKGDFYIFCLFVCMLVGYVFSSAKLLVSRRTITWKQQVLIIYSFISGTQMC